MRNILKVTSLVLSVAMLVGAGAAQAASGRLMIKGSDTVLPLAQRWAEVFMQSNRGAIIAVSGGGTGVGLSALAAGSCDIADASREAKSAEIDTARQRNRTLNATAVAKDGIAVIVNPKNPVKELTMGELKALYLGARSWKQVGGPDAPVVATGRDSSSGTYGFFQDAVLGGRNYRSDMITLPSNNSICQTVAQDKTAVGYVGLAYAKKFAREGKIHIVALSRGKGGAVQASDETVANGKYPLWRYLFCYTAGKPRGLASDYLKFVTGPEGQKIVEQVGYVPLR